MKIIILGAGQVGASVAESLVSEENDITMVDSDGERLAALQQTLKPGGCLVIQGYTPQQLEYKTGGPSALENLYTAELLQEAFAGWEFLHLREHESLVAEGLAHQGMSALVDAVIRKPA